MALSPHEKPVSKISIAGTETTQRVWMFVTLFPQASVREITEQLMISSTSVIAYHLRRLQDAGYIEQDERRQRTRRILVPYMTVEIKRSEVAHEPAR